MSYISIIAFILLINFRKQVFGIEASDVVLTDIRDNDVNGVDFDMFVLMQTALLNQQALLQAVQVGN